LSGGRHAGRPKRGVLLAPARPMPPAAGGGHGADPRDGIRPVPRRAALARLDDACVDARAPMHGARLVLRLVHGWLDHATQDADRSEPIDVVLAERLARIAANEHR
jgi:hypothetical protein